ncbi:MAG TPA: carbamoyltransferase C-terminal domain-containing protein [Patescibacteria group bacterium]|nr:carbamoyltransferase C-terminal domain-containing protein [Patescibacteria group bacterium]
MIALGISDNHDSGVCLWRDGRIISAMNEERLARQKLKGGFPHLSIERAMEDAGIKPHQIDLILLGSEMTPATLLRLWEASHDSLRRKSSSFSYLLNAYIVYQVLAHTLKVPQALERLCSEKIIRGRLRQLNIKAPVIGIEHHHAHASSAYYTSGAQDDALIITIDAMGDALSVTVNIGRHNTITRIFSQNGFSSISVYYSRLTEFLGFRPLAHEGKITSLAGYGKPHPRIRQIAEKQLRFVEKRGAFNLKNHFLKERRSNRLYRELGGYAREDIAYAFQNNFESQIAAFIDFWVKVTGIRNVCVAGGAFANVSVNRKISQSRHVDRLYIFPHMGDGGLALGAVCAFFRPDPFYLKQIYWGPAYATAYIQRLLGGAGLTHLLMEEEALCVRVAELLAQGKTVAHFNAGMEYGPRALGNRSILYRADDPTCLEWLNRKLARERFMPFAPVSLFEEAESLYTGINKIGYTLRFMNIAVDCAPAMKERCPGAVHIDGTARPQILHAQDNPRLCAIMREYEKRTGTSTVINTSFNRHEEPIVCSPGDAMRSFLECGLDYLVLNNFLVCQKNN